MCGNISLNISSVNQLEMPSPAAKEQTSPTAEHVCPLDGGGVGSGACDCVGAKLGMESMGVGAGEDGPGCDPAHWHRPSTLHGHHVCPPLPQGSQSSSPAFCELSDTATHSAQFPQAALPRNDSEATAPTTKQNAALTNRMQD
jgi:hypothetical protein